MKRERDEAFGEQGEAMNGRGPRPRVQGAGGRGGRGAKGGRPGRGGRGGRGRASVDARGGQAARHPEPGRGWGRGRASPAVIAPYPGQDPRPLDPRDWPPERYESPFERPYSPPYREPHPADRDSRRAPYFPAQQGREWPDRPPPAGYRGPPHPDDWFPPPAGRDIDYGPPPRQPSPRRQPPPVQRGQVGPRALRPDQPRPTGPRPRSSQPAAEPEQPGANTILDEFKITRKAVGAILGQKGARVKALRAETGANIHIKHMEDGQEFTVVELKGRPQQVADARRAIEHIVEEEQKPAGPKASAPQQKQQQQQKQAEEAEDKRITHNMIVLTRAVGAIIGPKGATVSGIRRDSGCGIHVCSMEKGQETTTVELHGMPDKVAAAENMILAVLDEEEARAAAERAAAAAAPSPAPHPAAAGPASRPRRAVEARRPAEKRQFGGPGPGPAGGWAREELVLSRQVVGTVMGRNGDNLGRISRETGAEVKVQDVDPNFQLLEVTGAGPQVAAAVEQIRAAQLVADGEFADSQVPAMEIKILPDMVGCIIGKAGSYVRNINRETGAVIRVKPQEGGATHQTVQIFGDPLQANRAHKMVVDALAKYDTAKVRVSPAGPGRRRPSSGPDPRHYPEPERLQHRPDSFAPGPGPSLGPEPAFRHEEGYHHYEPQVAPLMDPRLRGQQQQQQQQAPLDQDGQYHQASYAPTSGGGGSMGGQYGGALPAPQSGYLVQDYSQQQHTQQHQQHQQQLEYMPQQQHQQLDGGGGAQAGLLQGTRLSPTRQGRLPGSYLGQAAAYSTGGMDSMGAILDSGVPYNPAPLPASALQQAAAPAADNTNSATSLQQILQLIQNSAQPAASMPPPAAAPAPAPAPAPAAVQGLSADQLQILGQLAAVLAGSAQLTAGSGGGQR